MTKKQIAEAERERCKNLLREILPPGSTVQCILRHCSRSGMMREISLHAMTTDMDGKPWLRDITRPAAEVIGSRIGKTGGIRIGGCGMDMGFALVYELSRALYPEGFECIDEECPSSDHFNGDRDYTPHHHNCGGYALRKEWI